MTRFAPRLRAAILGLAVVAGFALSWATVSSVALAAGQCDTQSCDSGDLQAQVDAHNAAIAAADAAFWEAYYAREASAEEARTTHNDAYNARTDAYNATYNDPWNAYQAAVDVANAALQAVYNSTSDQAAWAAAEDARAAAMSAASDAYYAAYYAALDALIADRAAIDAAYNANLDAINAAYNAAADAADAAAIAADATYNDYVANYNACCGPGYCGDGVCGVDEGHYSLSFCPQDCPDVCGDGYCDTNGYYGSVEDSSICPQDCSHDVYYCGDGSCDSFIGEDSYTCPTDCSSSYCGDGYCDNAVDESSYCPQDCGGSCGDSYCDSSGYYGTPEDYSSCPADCANPCGDGYCDTYGYYGTSEDNASCPQDCSGSCGDNYCDSYGYYGTSEDNATCPQDCNPCGDGYCDTNGYYGTPEDYSNCSADCANPCGDGYCDSQGYYGNAETYDNCPSDCGGTGYWGSTDDTDWNNLSNWYADAALTIPADHLPDDTTNVVIEGVTPLADLDTWTQPASIDGPLSVTSASGGQLTVDVNGDVSFYGDSTLAYGTNIGSGAFYDQSDNESDIYYATFDGGVNGTYGWVYDATFNGEHDSSNPDCWSLYGNYSSNLGTVYSGTFECGSGNSGTVEGDATFTGGALNQGDVQGDATFSGQGGQYYGTVEGDATFNDSTWNGYDNNGSYTIGTVYGNATFNQSSSNWGNVNFGTFNDESTNKIGGNVSYATFNDSSANDGEVGNATFNDSSVNGRDDGYGYGNATVYGDATFNGDSSEDQAIVQGTKTRRYTSNTTTYRNFVSDGPWTVLADGAEVSLCSATTDESTTKSTASGGSFTSCGGECADPTASNGDPSNPGCNGDPSDITCCTYDGCNDPLAVDGDTHYAGCGGNPNDKSCCYYGCPVQQDTQNFTAGAQSCSSTPGDTSCCVYYGCLDQTATNFRADSIGCANDGSNWCCTYKTSCPDPNSSDFDPANPNGTCSDDPLDLSCCHYDCEDANGNLHGAPISALDFYSGDYCCADTATRLQPDGWCERVNGNDCHTRTTCQENVIDIDGNWTKIDSNPSNKKTPGGTCTGENTICAVASSNSCYYDYNCDSGSIGNTCDYRWDYTADMTCPSTVTGVDQSGFTEFTGIYSISFGQPCPTEEQARAVGQVAVFSQDNFCGLYDGNFDFAGDFYYNVATRDACLNLPGEQATVPNGFTQDANGTCLSDQCPNLPFAAYADNGDLAAAGITRTDNGNGIPPVCQCADPTYFYSATTGRCGGNCGAGEQLCPDGTCIPDGDTCDVCSNISGVQAEVPAGLVDNGNGACICPDPALKLCPDGPDYCIGADQCCSTDYTYCPLDGACYVNADYASRCSSCPQGAGCCGDNPPSWCVNVHDTCFSNPELVSACVTAYDKNNAPNAHGTLLDPLKSGSSYTAGQLDALFAGELNAQKVVPAGARKPVLGVIESVLGQETCTVTPCAYGDSCVDQANPATRQVEAKCVPEDLVATTTATTSLDLLTNWVRGAQISVVPALIPVGGQCLVLWTAQGMTSCSVTGPGLNIPAGSASQFAGYERTTPDGGSATYTITCDAVDGYTYKASDSCSVNPNIKEF